MVFRSIYVNIYKKSDVWSVIGKAAVTTRCQHTQQQLKTKQQLTYTICQHKTITAPNNTTKNQPNTPKPQHHNITTLHHNTTSQYHITTPQHHITTPNHNTTTCHHTTPHHTTPHHTTTLQHCNTPPHHTLSPHHNTIDDRPHRFLSAAVELLHLLQEQSQLRRQEQEKQFWHHRQRVSLNVASRSGNSSKSNLIFSNHLYSADSALFKSAQQLFLKS